MGPRSGQNNDMDPLNFLSHGSRRLASHQPHGESVHGSPLAWGTSGTHGIAGSSWSSSGSTPSLYFPQPQSRPHPSLETPHFGLPGSLSHPDRHVTGVQQEETLGGLRTLEPSHPGPAHSHSVFAGPTTVTQTGPAIHPTDMSSRGFGVGTAGVVLQPQSSFNLSSPAATRDAHSTPHNTVLAPLALERAANTYAQHGASHFSTPRQPYTFSPPRHSGPSSSNTSGNPRAGSSSASAHPVAHSTHDNSGLPWPASDRRGRNYTRARRYLASRQAMTDSIADDDRLTTMSESTDRVSRRPNRASLGVTLDNAAIRQLQLARGQAASKMVASKMALQSLQSVDIGELSEGEKTCVICYNDYGAESPEGINEAPLRLPRCKHVFGDHCIKKWFEDSDSCPYCRDKLPSEPKPNPSSARTFLNMIRLRGVAIPPGLPEHFYTRFLGGSSDDHLGSVLEGASRSGRTSERRSPPDDTAEDDHRRTRQRRSSPSPSGRPQYISSAATGVSRSGSQSAEGGVVSVGNGSPARANPRVPRRVVTGSIVLQGEAQANAEERGMTLQPDVSAPLATVFTSRVETRAGTHREVAGSVDQVAALAEAFDSNAHMANPLRNHPRVGLATSNINIPSLRPSPSGNSGSIRSSHSANATGMIQGQQSAEAPLGLNRSRPW